MNKLRTGDEVIVISGKDKGKTGIINKFLSGDKCEVAGIKMVKKHQKPNPQANIQGGIIEKESSIHLSNIAIYNKKAKKADKVKIEANENGKKRIFKSDGKEV
jgi:large subunit ribosomal protein L24